MHLNATLDSTFQGGGRYQSFFMSLIKQIEFNYRWNALPYFASQTLQRSVQHKSIWRRKLFRVNGLCWLWFTHTSTAKGRKKGRGKDFTKNHLFCAGEVPWFSVTALEHISRENLQSTVSTILNCYPPIALSTDAPSNRQLACCIFPLIFHISLWRDIIPDDYLSVMVYDEKCSGLLMWDVSVYHFDGWPPW